MVMPLAFIRCPAKLATHKRAYAYADTQKNTQE